MCRSSFSSVAKNPSDAPLNSFKADAPGGRSPARHSALSAGLLVHKPDDGGCNFTSPLRIVAWAMGLFYGRNMTDLEFGDSSPFIR